MSTTTSTTTPDVKVEEETYTGSCHCQSFTYTLRHAPLTGETPSPVGSCNCSICTRNGYLTVYAPKSGLTFTKGSLDLFSKYLFATKRLAHYFCPFCGTSCMVGSIDAEYYPDLVCVNVRTLEGVDFKALTVREMDGASA